MNKLIFVTLFSLLVLAGCLVETQEEIKNITITNPETTIQNTTNTQEADQTTSINQTTNQTINTTETTYLCDLYVKNMTVSTLYPDIGDDVEIDFIINNIGKVNCPAFNYSVFITKNNKAVKTEYFNVEGLNKSKSISKEYEYEFGAEGNYTIEIFADNANKIAEESEKNNKASKKFYVKATDEESDENDYTDYNCTDSDKADKKVAGTCTDDLGSVIQDICLSSSILWEAKCIDGKCDYYTNITCVCVEGACQ